MSGERKSISEQLLCPTLRPLIECCVQRAIDASIVVDAVQQLFVEISKEELSLESESVSLSQLEIMTGLPKKQVGKLSKKSETPKYSGGVIGKILCAWEVDKRFCNAGNEPRSLKFRGKRSEFAKLVRSVDKDCSINALRRELARRKLVEEQGELLVRVASYESYHTKQERGINLLYRDIQAIVNAVGENVLLGPQQRNLHLRTEFDNISPEKLPAIRKWLRKEGERFHKRARVYLAKHDLDHQDAPKGSGGGKVVLGAFSWTD